MMEGSEAREEFLTVAEVAETLKLNQQTVRNWIDQGSLPALRVGRRVRIKRSDFERVLERGYSAGSGTGPAGPAASPSAEDFWGGTPVGLAEPAAAQPPVADPAAGSVPVADPAVASAPAAHQSDRSAQADKIANHSGFDDIRR
jgi:excisionase family DNA binding protein